jgi:hypothetical protein
MLNLKVLHNGATITKLQNNNLLEIVRPATPAGLFFSALLIEVPNHKSGFKITGQTFAYWQVYEINFSKKIHDA